MKEEKGSKSWLFREQINDLQSSITVYLIIRKKGSLSERFERKKRKKGEGEEKKKRDEKFFFLKGIRTIQKSILFNFRHASSVGPGGAYSSCGDDLPRISSSIRQCRSRSFARYHYQISTGSR